MYRGKKFGELGAKIAFHGIRRRRAFGGLEAKMLKEIKVPDAHNGGKLGVVKLNVSVITGAREEMKFGKLGTQIQQFGDSVARSTYGGLKLGKLGMQKSSESVVYGTGNALKYDKTEVEEFSRKVGTLRLSDSVVRGTRGGLRLDTVVRGTRGGLRIGNFEMQRLVDSAVRDAYDGLKLEKLGMQKSNESASHGTRSALKYEKTEAEESIKKPGRLKWSDSFVHGTPDWLKLGKVGNLIEKFSDSVSRSTHDATKLGNLGMGKFRDSVVRGTRSGLKHGRFGMQRLSDSVVRSTRSGLKHGRFGMQRLSDSVVRGTRSGLKHGRFGMKRLSDSVVRGTRSGLKHGRFGMRRLGDSVVRVGRKIQEFGADELKNPVARSTNRGTLFEEHARNLQTVASEDKNDHLQTQVLVYTESKSTGKSTRRGKRSNAKSVVPPEILELLKKNGDLALAVLLHVVYPGSECVIYFAKSAYSYHKGNNDDAMCHFLRGVMIALCMSDGQQTENTEQSDTTIYDLFWFECA